MTRKKHVQDFGFNYHGVVLERDGQRYQVIHQTNEISYAVALDSKGRVGGGVVRFNR